LLWRKKFGRRTGGLEKGVGVGEASRVGGWKREPVERLRFIDMVGVKWVERSGW